MEEVKKRDWRMMRTRLGEEKVEEKANEMQIMQQMSVDHLV
jgi:hypothetical protein